MFAGLALFLRLLVGKLAEVEHPANGRVGVRGHFDQIQFRVFRDAQSFEEWQNTPIFTSVIDQTHLAGPDLPVDPVINGDGFGYWWALYSLNLLPSLGEFQLPGIRAQLTTKYRPFGLESNITTG